MGAYLGHYGNKTWEEIIMKNALVLVKCDGNHTYAVGGT